VPRVIPGMVITKQHLPLLIATLLPMLTSSASLLTDIKMPATTNKIETFLKKKNHYRFIQKASYRVHITFITPNDLLRNAWLKSFGLLGPTVYIVIYVALLRNFYSDGCRYFFSN
jgi:hypothetical protein